MTAPRRTARPTPLAGPRRRPSSITLALASLSLAVALPIGALAAANAFDTAEVEFSVIAGTVLLAVVVFLAATKRRAGVRITLGGLALPAVVSAALILAGYLGTGFAVDAATGPEHDFFGEEELWALVAAAIVTYIVVYATLSMARR